MQSLLETLIYLLGIMGIMFTTMSVFEVFIYKSIEESTCDFILKRQEKIKSDEGLNICIFNLTDKEKEVVRDTVKCGEFSMIEKIVNENEEVKIEIG